MPKVIFDDDATEIELQEGEALQACCEEHGIPFACAEGICGTCVISIPADQDCCLNSPNEAEQDFFGDMPSRILVNGQPRHERLACQCCLQSGTINIKF